MARAQEEYDIYVRDHFRRGAMQQLSDQERDEILAGLKANWEQIHHEYQVKALSKNLQSELPSPLN